MGDISNPLSAADGSLLFFFPCLILFAVESIKVSLLKLSSDLNEYIHSLEFLNTVTCPSVYEETLTMEKHTEFSVCERWGPRRRGAKGELSLTVSSRPPSPAQTSRPH